MRQGLVWAVGGFVFGLAAGAGASYAFWARAATAAHERLASLEATATQVQAERERLHRELTDIVRERHEMAGAAEHLRTQIGRQLQRLEALAQELGEHPDDDDTAAGDVPASPAP